MRRVVATGVRTFLPWFVTAVLLATAAAECGAERAAGTMAADLDGEVRRLRAEMSAMQEENAQLQWKAICAKDERACLRRSE
jgi:hypothetical protein